MNECPREDYPSSKMRWLYLVATRSFCPRGSSSSVMSRRIVFRLSAPDADSSGSTQQHFRNANATVFYDQPVTTVSDNEDNDNDDLRPGDRLCTPANRYTFYALRLVCRFRSFRVARSIMCELVLLLLNFRLKFCSFANHGVATVMVELSRLVAYSRCI